MDLKTKIQILFYICVSTCMVIVLYTPSPYFAPFPPFFPPPFLSFTSRQTPLDNMTAASLFYAVSHFHKGRGKLQKTCADLVSHLTESGVPRVS